MTDFDNIGNLNETNGYVSIVSELASWEALDLDLDWDESWYFNIYNNQLCPPYPTCIEDYVGEQDTTNCD